MTGQVPAAAAASATDRSRTNPAARAGRRRATAACLLGGSLLLTGAVGAASPAAADTAASSGTAHPTVTRAATAAAGDLLEVTLDQLHPTQPSLGYDQIYYKLDRYASPKDEANGDVNKRFDDWCETNGQGEAADVPAGAVLADPSTFTCEIPEGQETADSLADMKTVVVGPDGKLYLTDGHHSLTAFWEAADGGPKTPVRLIVQANLSNLSTSAFWKRMEANNWVWLKDENGSPITVADLPARLGLSQFHDDPYRSLVYLTRDIGYTQEAGSTEYLEFLWGTWLRGRIDLADYDLNDPASYLRAVKDASVAMTSVPSDTVIAGGATAAELGQLALWNDGKKETKGEFGDLSKALTEDKPGKIAYALDYRATVPADPACTRTVTGTRLLPLIVTSGTTCLDRATVLGGVAVAPGASLVAKGADITGPVTSLKARTVEICGSTVTGPVTLLATTDRATLTGPGCSANTVRGRVTVVAGS
ncbi:ParB-like protein [Streptomyces sp. NPDC008150]|uniref:ParB/Srx family N-terminal domain-containing protein n=1 Tax=Streptomyces sp. NPDC008150 TaxID=3364816 RepID=UPI0036ECA638